MQNVDTIYPDNMLWLAVKTLFHEKGRLIITLMGITFSTILVLAQMGMYLGMMGNATALIRNIDADIWVASKNIQSLDFANAFPEERINRVNALPDVEWAERLMLTWGILKLASGGQEQVQIVGYNPDTGVGAPWSMAVGTPYDVKGGSYMIADITSEQRLGKLDTGMIWELSEKRFKLVALSKGIKSFTTAPMLFMTYKQAQNFYIPGYTTFIVAKIRDKGKIDDVVQTLRATMKDNDIFTSDDFVYKTAMYWTVQTGLGMGFFITALLGLAVGGAIVGQTIYANTMEHMMEFGTLKAIGARNSDLYSIIFSQAGISAVIGYAAGSAFILLVRSSVEKVGVTLYIGPVLFAVLFIIILMTCLLSAYFSVRKVRRLDPVMVFRG